MLKKIKFIDLFCGIGGFHRALLNHNTECVLASDINKDCREVYYKNYNIVPFGDLTKININEIPEHSLLCAGFPCQPFSICGLQKGFEDERGNLFFEILKIIKIKKPNTILLENVKNLISHDNGNTFKTIIFLLENEKYNINYKILNAKDFGVPQNRERIIIVANKNFKFDFDKIEFKKEVCLNDYLNLEQNISYLKKEDYTILPKELWTKQKSGLVFCGYLNKNIRKNGVKDNTLHLSRTHRQTNRIYHINGNNPTINSQELSGRYYIYDNFNVRKLTINECYSLMGFNKDFIKSKSISNQYKQIGNSVCIPMVEAVFNQIVEQFY